MAIQASVYTGALLQSLIAANPSHYSGVNVQLNSVSGCAACSTFPSLSSTFAPMPTCAAGATLINGNQCSSHAACPAGFTDNSFTCVDANGATSSYICPAGAALSATTQAVCIAPATELCPIGFAVAPGAAVCAIVCPSGFFKLQGSCTRAVTCPAGTTFDASQSNPRNFCQDINECLDPITCQNGGACSNAYGSYSCFCTPEFDGTNCTNIAGSSSSASTGGTKVGLALGAGLGAGIGLFIVAVIIVIVLRRRNSRAKSSDLGESLTGFDPDMAQPVKRGYLGSFSGEKELLSGLNPAAGKRGSKQQSFYCSVQAPPAGTNPQAGAPKAIKSQPNYSAPIVVVNRAKSAQRPASAKMVLRNAFDVLEESSDEPVAPKKSLTLVEDSGRDGESAEA